VVLEDVGASLHARRALGQSRTDGHVDVVDPWVSLLVRSHDGDRIGLASTNVQMRVPKGLQEAGGEAVAQRRGE
jgi:hypothetical protein